MNHPSNIPDTIIPILVIYTYDTGHQISPYTMTIIADVFLMLRFLIVAISN